MSVVILASFSWCRASQPVRRHNAFALQDIANTFLRTMIQIAHNAKGNNVSTKTRARQFLSTWLTFNVSSDLLLTFVH